MQTPSLTPEPETADYKKNSVHSNGEKAMPPKIRARNENWSLMLLNLHGPQNVEEKILSRNP